MTVTKPLYNFEETNPFETTTEDYLSTTIDVEHESEGNIHMEGSVFPTNG